MFPIVSSKFFLTNLVNLAVKYTAYALRDQYTTFNNVIKIINKIQNQNLKKGFMLPINLSFLEIQFLRKNSFALLLLFLLCLFAKSISILVFFLL